LRGGRVTELFAARIDIWRIDFTKRSLQRWRLLSVKRVTGAANARTYVLPDPVSWHGVRSTLGC